jgi:hypothetical protein
MAMGQAAGTAAAIAATGNCSPREVAANQLRARLIENGAILSL